MLILVSCKDEANESDGSFPDNIQVVWQEEGYDDGDVVGIYFTSSKYGFWDYMGDEYRVGDDCYYAIDFAELLSRDGDNYRMKVTSEWAEEGEGEEGVFTLKVEGNMLTMTEPGDDSYEDVYSKDSKSVSDLTPKCSGELAKANPKMDKLQKLLK